MLLELNSRHFTELEKASHQRGAIGGGPRGGFPDAGCFEEKVGEYPIHANQWRRAAQFLKYYKVEFIFLFALSKKDAVLGRGKKFSVTEMIYFMAQRYPNVEKYWRRVLKNVKKGD